MQANRIMAWEDRLTRLSFGLLSAAVGYGILAGAVIAMYYDVVAGMDALEDDLGSVQGLLYLAAILAGLIHLPLAAADVGSKRWKQAMARLAIFIAPAIVFLGVGGLVSHSLWWLPISDTDRFHILHHTIFAGVPLTLGFWLALRAWWRPEAYTALPIARSSLIASGAGGLALLFALSVALGGVSPMIVGLFALAAVGIALLVRRPAP